MNSTQKKRLGLIAGGLIICGAAAALVFNAFEEEPRVFLLPSQVAAHEAPEAEHSASADLYRKVPFSVRKTA